MGRMAWLWLTLFAIAALVAHFTLVVERSEEPPKPGGEKVDVE